MITSQIDTAPKLLLSKASALCGLITSQIDTAPKHYPLHGPHWDGLITSQIDTAPKRNLQADGICLFDYQSD